MVYFSGSACIDSPVGYDYSTKGRNGITSQGIFPGLHQGIPGSHAADIGMFEYGYTGAKVIHIFH